MRVAIFVTNPPDAYSGGRYSALMMAEALASRGHEVCYVTNHEPVFFSDFAAFPAHGRIRVCLTADFKSRLPEGHFDFVVTVPGPRPTMFYLNALLFAQRRGAHAVFFNFESGNWFNALSPAPRDLKLWENWRLSCRYSSLIISNAEEGDRWARPFYTGLPPETHFAACPLSINTFAADAAGAPEREKRLLFFARFVMGEHKGGAQLASILGEAMRGYCLVLVVGVGELPEAMLAPLREKAAAHGIELEVLSRLSDEEKFRQIKRARLVLFPSYFEGYGLPPVEALYCETPCVAFDLPVLRETCGEKLVYARHGDWEDFRRKTEEELARPYSGEGMRAQVEPIARLEAYAALLEAAMAPVLALPRPLERHSKWNRARLLARRRAAELLTAYRARAERRRREAGQQAQREERARQASEQAAQAAAARRDAAPPPAANGGPRTPVKPEASLAARVKRTLLELAAPPRRRWNTPQRRAERRGIVCYYPPFATQADLANHFYRAQWYFPEGAPVLREIIFFQTFGPEGAGPGPRPEAMGPAPRPFPKITIRRGGRWANFRQALHSQVVLICKGWRRSLLRRAADALGLSPVNVNTTDITSTEYGTYPAAVWRYFMTPDARAAVIAESRERFLKLAEEIRASAPAGAAVFGTGPSLEEAPDIDFTGRLTIICNSTVQNDRLLDHLRPHFVCAADAVSHLGVSAYAHQFRADLLRVLRERDIYWFSTANLAYILTLQHPELREKTILIEQTIDGPHYDLVANFGAPRLDSILNIIMLPLAATFAREIWILGCDGKSATRSNEDFWAHAREAQYHNLVDTGHICHPTFDQRRQKTTYSRYNQSVEDTIRIGEQEHGIRYRCLRPSNIEVLNARYSPGPEPPKP